MRIEARSARLLLAVSALVLPWCAVGQDAPAKAEPKSPPSKSSRQTWEDMRTVDLQRPATNLPPPPDAAQRREAFARRNDPEQIKALAGALFALWDTGETKASREEITRRLEPMKAEVYKLYRAEKYQEALDAFRAYFFAKLRLVFRDEKGLTSREYEGRFASEAARRNYEGTVALLMDNVHQVAATKETVRIGEPGVVRWDWKPSGPRLWENFRAPGFEYFSTGASRFEVLWWKFTDTRDLKYLEKYLAFADDYTLNHKLQEDLSAGNIDLGKQGANDAFAYLHGLSETARHLPADGRGYSSASLARMLVRLLTLELPQSLYYNREQSNNHSCGATHAQLALSNYLYDFRFARVLERESRRQFEAYGTLFDLPDGAMPGRHQGYAYHELRENLIFFEAARDYDYDWFTPQWRREAVDRLLRRGYYLMNLYAAQGETVQVYKGDRRNAPFETTYARWVNRHLPELWQLPSMSAISTRIIHNQLPHDAARLPADQPVLKDQLGPGRRGRVQMSPARPIASEGQGVAVGAEPLYTSLSFPYTGTHVMRSGWDPATSSYGVFVETRARGDEGGLFKEAKACNLLEIGAFGQDLFNNGVGFAYNFVPSPVLVDGLQQFSINGKGPGARKGDNNEGLKPISPYRIHHSTRYDVAEGCYDGVWADTIDHDPPFYDYHYRLDVQKKAVSGITHRRVVQFAKSHGLWVVFDHLGASGAHTYTQQFFMPELQPKVPDGYTADQFVVDQPGRTLKSVAPGNVNLAMHYAGPAAEQLTILPVIQKERPVDPYNFYRGDRHDEYTFLHLRSQWAATGDSLLITVLQATGPNGRGAAVTKFTRATDGFTAKLASGATVRCRARLTADARVPSGIESTLTVTEADGSENGIVLGKDSHEFGPAMPITPPIPELVITPECNVFVDALPVTVACADGNATIHYTLDGTDPTLDSPRYSGPVTLTGSAMFKARAFRKGLARMPADQTSGTLMGRVHTAVFTREEPQPSDPVQEASLKAGLRFQHFRGKWPYLLFGAPTLKPVREGVAADLFDLAANAGNKGAFGFAWQGYLRVPADGVYTLHAPEEFMKYRPLAGYDLCVWLGRPATSATGAPGVGAALKEWYPATRRHAFGTWSVALKKGLHPIRVDYADLRPGAVLEYIQFTHAGLNVPGLTKTFFDGPAPSLRISGPGLGPKPIPREWLVHPEPAASRPN